MSGTGYSGIGHNWDLQQVGSILMESIACGNGRSMLGSGAIGSYWERTVVLGSNVIGYKWEWAISRIG